MKYLIPILLFSIFCNSNIYAAKPIFTDSLDSAVRIQESSQNKDILVIFGAGWCKHCSALKNDINTGSLDNLLNNKIVCYIDVDKNIELKNKYKISSMPDSKIIRSEKIVSKITGYSKEQYIRWLTKNSQ